MTGNDRLEQLNSDTTHNSDSRFLQTEKMVELLFPILDLSIKEYRRKNLYSNDGKAPGIGAFTVLSSNKAICSPDGGSAYNDRAVGPPSEARVPTRSVGGPYQRLVVVQPLIWKRTCDNG